MRGVMELEKFRIINELTYKNLAELLGFSENKTYRVCNDNRGCVKLVDAHNIVIKTRGTVNIEDLLPIEGDC